MSGHDLQSALNAQGYGSGKRVIDLAYAEKRIREALPAPSSLLPVMAAPDDGRNWTIAHFGCDAEMGADWALTTVNVRASDTIGKALMQGAREDAETIAAIVNAYRLGILVLSDE